MADWSPLRAVLSEIDVQATFDWSELDALVGGLPRSAYDYSAFWKGNRSGWPGFTTADVEIGKSVTFVRRPLTVRTPRRLSTSNHDEMRAPDLVLLGCVKSKLSYAAPARELYTSSLFRKGRAHAEATGAAWFILSAEHGLVAPTTVLDPYELRLSATPREYRRVWGARVVDQLVEAVGLLEGKQIEVHAGSAYSDAIRAGVEARGAHVIEPLRGLSMGRRLAWYTAPQPEPRPSSWTSLPTVPDVADIADELGRDAGALTPSEFLATEGIGLRAPGLYSWWIDERGAQDLSTGVGSQIEPGLIYAGLAGATRSQSGRKSTNTLWGRIRGMHLGGRHQLSTFRLSLGSILASSRGEEAIDESRLTGWMHEHLRVVTVVVADGDVLDALESAVLLRLDPPLNLAKMQPSETRAQLTVLRRRFGRRGGRL